MRLEDLPPEIMRELTAWAGGFGTICLWASGSFALRKLMSDRGGVNRISLADTSPRSTSRWPMMLGELKGLTDLRINRGFWPLCDHQLVRKELKKLVNLRILHLMCSDSGLILLGDIRPNWPKIEDFRVTALLSPLHVSGLPETLVKIHISSHSWFSIAAEPTETTKLPFLEEMSIETDLPLQIFSLTPSLTRLRTKTCNAAFAEVLPPTLTRLRTTITKIEILKMLPSGLQILKVKVPFEIIDENCFLHFKSLRKLVLSSTGFSNLETTLSVCPFPSSLESLKITKPYVVDRFEMPSSLTSLELSALCFRGPISIGKVPNLRRLSLFRLRYLEGDDADDAIMAHVSLLPKSLTELEISKEVELPPNGWHILPPQLEKLALSRIGPEAPYSAAQFSHLRELTLDCKSDFDFDFLAFLPKTFTSLQLTCPGPIPMEVFDMLPTEIRKLHLTERGKSGELTIQGLSSLSALVNLVELYCPMNLPLIEDEMINWLPRSLIALHLPGHPAKLTSACFAYLPRQLQSLTLNSISKGQIADVAWLPRGLRTLTISRAQWFTKECFPLLPTTIMYSSRLNDLDSAYWKSIGPANEETPDPRTSTNSYLSRSRPSL